MADITINYKGDLIGTIDASGTTVLETAGKYCEDDITLVYDKPSGGEVDPPDDGKTHLFIRVPRDGGTYLIASVNLGSGATLTIDWGDGDVHSYTSNGTITKTYALAGDYEIVMSTQGNYGSLTTDSLGASNLTTQARAVYAPMLKRAYFYDQDLYLSLNDSTTVGRVVEYCPCLTKVVLPSGKAELAANAFTCCYALESINIPSGVTTIGNFAFRYDFSLGEITLPASVTSIGGNAFAYCKGLEEIHVLAATPPTIANTTFSNTPSTMKIYVPSASLAAYQAASYWSTYASQIYGE